jgi:hypothetical protein
MVSMLSAVVPKIAQINHHVVCNGRILVLLKIGIAGLWDLAVKEFR